MIRPSGRPRRVPQLPGYEADVAADGRGAWRVATKSTRSDHGLRQPGDARRLPRPSGAGHTTPVVMISGSANPRDSGAPRRRLRLAQAGYLAQFEAAMTRSLSMPHSGVFHATTCPRASGSASRTCPRPGAPERGDPVGCRDVVHTTPTVSDSGISRPVCAFRLVSQPAGWLARRYSSSPQPCHWTSAVR
jgi:hypothetical protein